MGKKLSLVCILLLILLSLNGQAQENQIELKAMLDKKEVALGDYVSYRLVISSLVNLINPRIQLPSLANDFIILSSGRSQNISYSSGKTKTQIILDELLQPKKEGEITIGAALVSNRGKVYKSEILTLKVNPGKTPIPETPPEAKEEQTEEEKIPPGEKITL